MSTIYKLLSWSKLYAFRTLNQCAHKCFRFANNSGNLPASIHTTSLYPAKMFLDTENKHSYEIFQRLPNYKLSEDIAFQWELDSCSKENIRQLLNDPPISPEAVVKGLEIIVGYCNRNSIDIGDEQFDNFIDNFGIVCEKFTDEQLQVCLSVLRFLPDPYGVNSRNYYELWKPLDDICQMRLVEWPTDKILLICDCWYQLNLAKCSDFVWDGIKKLGRKTRRLTASQLVQTMFLCNLVRRPLVEMMDFEMRLESLFDTLTLDEVGIMCAGFFKTQTKLKNSELVMKLYRRLLDNLDVVDDITLVNYLKTLRYSSKLPEEHIMYELLDKLCDQIHRISLMSCLHVALTGCDIQMCHRKCVEKILERFDRDIEQVRLKDMERIAHVMALFNVDTESGVHETLCEKVLKKLETRIDEIIRYPKCFQACLHYLTLCGHHNEDMINAVLDEKFIKHVYGKNILLGREVFCLDSFARINLKDSYTGNLLSNGHRKTMGKLFTHFIPERDSKFKLNATDRILLEVKETCQNVWGINTVKHVLPHFERPDVVIAYDSKARKGVRLNEVCNENYSGRILSRDDIIGTNEGHMKSAVVAIGGWNNFIRNSNKPTGLLAMKMKQLKMLGHTTALIPWYEWRELETHADKHKYVRRKLGRLLEATN